MTTPIKPPGGSSPAGASGASSGADHGRVEGRSGELRSLVDGGTDVRGPTAAQAGDPLSLPAIERDVRAGTIDVDQAIDRLVARALERAAGLPADQRAVLETNLRSALAEDPTLLALRKDLERGSSS
jgi:hypothetical protein